MSDLVTVKLVDSTFPGAKSMSAADQTADGAPRHFRWDRTPGRGMVKVFTDIRLHEAYTDNSLTKVALLIEPRGLAPQNYQMVESMLDEFRWVLTHDKKLLELHSQQARFYPFGGTRLTGWGLKAKAHLCSLIVGKKDKTEGHQLRHAAAQKFSDLHLYGQPYTPWLENKHPALDAYCFSVVIENTREDYWFTEKLIDCLAVGTIPIYWGCPDIGRFVDPRGLLTFSDLDELENILAELSFEQYAKMRPYAHFNLQRAREYRCAEDWIYRQYQGTGLFHKVKI